MKFDLCDADSCGNWRDRNCEKKVHSCGSGRECSSQRRREIRLWVRALPIKDNISKVSFCQEPLNLEETFKSVIFYFVFQTSPLSHNGFHGFVTKACAVAHSHASLGVTSSCHVLLGSDANPPRARAVSNQHGAERWSVGSVCVCGGGGLMCHFCALPGCVRRFPRVPCRSDDRRCCGECACAHLLTQFSTFGPGGDTDHARAH